jgi:hypothetical protein
MARSKRRTGSVRIDTVPLPEKVAGLKTLAGRIRRVRGRYVLTVRGRNKEIPAVGTPAPELAKMVGKDVVALVSRKGGGAIVAIGSWPTPEAPSVFRRPRILCYIPARETFRALDPHVRNEILRGLVRTGAATPELQEEYGRVGR